MSLYGSQRVLYVSRSIGSRPDLSGRSGQYAQSEAHGGSGYGQEYMYDNTYTYSKASMRGGGGGQGQFPLSGLHQKAYILQGQCQDNLRKAEHYLQAGSDSGRGTVEADHYMALARETLEQLKACALDLRQMGQPNDSVVRSVEMCRDQLTGVHMAINGTMQRRSRGSRGSGAWEEAGWSFNEAMAWIGHQKHLIETAQWGDNSADVEHQLISHSKFHSSIQRSPEVDKAKVELIKKGDKANQYALDQEWDTLQRMSHGRSDQLREMQQIIEAISRQIMWVNVREEEELVFDWGDKNIDLYIPKKQESYSKLMSALEEKDKDLNKLKLKVDSLLKNPHPASDKIEAYMDTLQTQWSWLLQITKCIHVHLKENADYSEFFKEANEMYNKLQKAHENIRKKFTSDRNTPLENLLELLKGLEKEKERIMENKRQVQHLVNKSKSIVRLRPRNPEEEKSCSPVMVQALCDFKQDQKVILKGNEGILKDNSQRSKWQVTGPGGLDMLVPSVCLLVPPPNSLGINLANKNEQYYEAILSVWNQLYINIKSLISWQYYVQALTRINSLTVTMLSRMRPEEYRSILKSLEAHYSEFTHCCHGSEMFKDEDKQSIESQYTGAHAHYDRLLVQLPVYTAQQTGNEEKIKAEEEARILAAEKEEDKVVGTKQDHVKKVVVKKKVASVTSQSLTELHKLRLRLEGAEAGLTQHIHICLAEDGAHGLRITQLESVQRDVDSIREEYLRLNERVLKELENMTDSDKATFLHSQLGLINERLGSLDECFAAYLQRLRALRVLLQSVSRAEDIIKVHEARLTEKETTSLNPAEVGDYRSTLKSMRAELEGKRAVLVSMETELGKAVHWNGQVGRAFHRCDVDLSIYSEQVNQLSDRWRRLQSQLDSRLRDLEGYLHLLQQYTTTSSVLSEWICATRQKHDALQATKIDSITALDEHLNQQKVLNSEIKGKRESVVSVLGDTDACVNSIKDYELELASYSAGLETLLNIPMKRTMLQSPSTKLTEETTLLQTRYIELLTLSGDYNKYLGELHNNMETLKMRNTRIDLLEEELRLLKEDIEDHNAKNSSLEEALVRYRLELSQSQEQLLSVEEVKRSTALQCSATQDSLASTRGQLKELQEQVTRLNSLVEEEKRKRRMADERYGELQDEHEQVLRRRQKELEQANWAKMEVEKSVGTQEREAERLRKQLEEEEQRFKELEQELSKVRTQCSVEISNQKLSYESQITICRMDIQHLSSQREEVDQGIKLQCERLEADRRDQEDQLRRLNVSLSQAEEQRTMAEEEAHSQRSVVTEEARRRRELEAQVEILVRQRGEDSSQYRGEVSELTKALQDRSGQLVLLTHSLDEEQRRRRALEEERTRMELLLGEIRGKRTSSSQAVTRLREVEEELVSSCTEFKKVSGEKNKAEQSVARLQGSIKELQATLERKDGEVEALRRTGQEEVIKRRHVETELQKTNHTMREYTSTITTLRRSQEEAKTVGRRGEEEHRKLQEELERRLKEFKASTECLASLSSELKSLQQHLLQEQAKVREANLCNETLYKTIEEKSRVLNESSVEHERLQTLTQTLTKERLRLEEELRGVKHEREELLRTRQGADDELVAQITVLELQLKSSSGSSLDTQSLVAELSSEREKLRMEIGQLQGQVFETSCLIQSTETQYNEIEMERDALLLKLKQTNQDRARSQKLEEELNHMKVSLESESRIKLCLQEENEKVKKDFLYWKGQYESKEGEVRQFNSEKEKLERERSSLKTEIERLMRELREVEERHKSRLLITQTQFSELTSVRDSLEAELSKLRKRPYAFAKHTQTDESGKKDLDPATLVFEGVRKMVMAKQLLDCGVINKVTYGQLLNGQKTVREVSVDIKLNLKGTGSISGVAVGPQGKMSLTEAKRENILSEDSAILLLEAQAATGHIVDPRVNEKMTVQEACKRGVVYEEDRERLLIAEAACLGYRDPNTTKLLSAGQAMRKGLIDRVTALRMLQAQESVGGIIDPVLSVFLPKDAAMDRDLIDEDLYRALNQRPECYLDPDTQLGASYVSLKRRCKAEPTTGLLILPAPEKPMTVKGLRGEVSVTDLMSANLLEKSDMDQLKEGKLTSQDIEHRLRSYLRGSTCIAGVYNEANDKILSIYQAMKEGLLKPSTTLELLEAQAASGFMIDPVNNLCLTVVDAYKRGLAGPELKDKLLSAERAVTGYKDPGTDKIISLFQAIEKGLIEKEHGIHLLEAQIASGGIIDPRHSHRIEVVTAYKKGYFSKEMNQILTDEGDNSKGFFDPNNQDNLTYLQLKKRCIIDQKTGLVLLSIKKKKEPPQPITQKSTQRKRRVVIVDPDTNKDMSVKEAYDKGLIDYEMFLELSQQECEWEEITTTTQDGSKRLVIFDRKTEIQYDIRELLEKSVINQSLYDQYRSQMITLTQFADIITSKTKANRSSASSSSSSSTSSSKARAAATSAAAYSSLLSSSTTYSPRITSTSSTSIKAEKTSSIIGSSTIGPSSIGDCSTITRSTTSSSFTQPDGPSSPSTLKHIASISVSLACPAEAVVLDGEQSPVGAIFDMEALEKISISEAHKRGLVDSISAQRLLEAQACTGGIVNPSDGRRLSIQEASSQGIIENDMATRLKPAQKAYIGFEDIKCKHKMSAAEAMREKWLPYEAGHRFLEFQFVTGGLYDPELGRRRTIKEALKEGWLDGRGAQKLQDTRHHAKNLTCPKTKLKISYKEAMDNCLVEENTGVKMLQAASASSRGISSPYNSSTPGSTSGSRTGSRASSRRGSLDLGSSGSSRRYSIVSSTTYSRTSFSSSSMS
nr:desmoplakin-like isoform X1 [Oncorhynchus nerka]XP_029542770.1 desmoplakin-like isoform X1 [Oncorhynchus nerka]XP_029542771.1 desmoplakin-like isoform X1 [Oncorhynchus nerka]XP_029542772.1 desmoplakin-like isoform X1 [Oncorhynchus nerka]XP_029542773.1 desmoplakin-like isoform X1 [Oncorhynchus nerka]